MSARILDGKLIAEQVLAECQDGVKVFREKHGLPPGLAFVRVGDDPASIVYVGAKAKMCERLGIQSQTFVLPADIPEEQVLELVGSLNQQKTIHGILVQSPMAPSIREDAVFEAIDPMKDVDGIHPANLGKLVADNATGFAACTPAGVQQILVRSGIEIAGRRVVVLGRSRLVGKPLALLLLNKGGQADATVTVCHSRTRNLAEVTRQADILIAAIGKARFVTAEMVREGAVVIDVGINRIPDPSKKAGHHLEGDVDFGAVVQKAAAITPVPGGVGPMTIAMLMVNTLKAACLQMGKG
ncbi:MAG: bifunctional methylenetetrahydrofolate dehydrogenase/methenyltetrahydrofolate cyclohydrolase FolD [Verrucomicrobiae bacterium]|nr:bifunctional methylenetetrahydrofolate dehydrogenase/methenyltetrahydrofolate cyclohydrolase FolD [Verrucomicrobiae bacterium]